MRSVDAGSSIRLRAFHCGRARLLLDRYGVSRGLDVGNRLANKLGNRSCRIWQLGSSSSAAEEAHPSGLGLYVHGDDQAGNMYSAYAQLSGASYFFQRLASDKQTVSMQLQY